MKAHTKAIAMMVTILLTLAVAAGLKLVPSFRKSAPSPQATSPFSTFGQPGMAIPDMTKIAGDQAKLFELMNHFKLNMRLATYIAQAKLQVVSQTDTSVHFVITYPDNATTDETFTVAADPNYTPTSADLERAARTASKVHGPKLTVKKNGPNEWQYTLQYHVPYSAIPNDLLQQIQPPSNSPRSSVDFLDLIPSVHADGGLVAGEGAVSVVANYFATSQAKLWEREARSVGVDVPLALVDLGDDLLTFKRWMGEMGELEDCAKNPTNPLSQKATHDPNYQHDVLDPLSDAKGDVQSTLVPTLASDTAGFLTHWLPFGSGALAGLIFSTQDEAIADYAEGRIEEARKYVVPCHHEQMSAGQFLPMQANLKYSYNRNIPNECDKDGNCSQGEEKRVIEGTVHMTPDSTGFLVGKGAAQVTMEMSQHATNQYGGGSENHETSKGVGELAVRGGGATPQIGVVKAEFHTETLTTDGDSKTGKLPPKHWHNENGFFGMDCDFYNVNFVRGGTYTAFQGGNDKNGTCTLEIFPE